MVYTSTRRRRTAIITPACGIYFTRVHILHIVHYNVYSTAVMDFNVFRASVRTRMVIIIGTARAAAVCPRPPAAAERLQRGRCGCSAHIMI